MSGLRNLTDDEYYAHIEANGHILRREPSGRVDIFYLDYDCHNGPGCVRCHESWCHHCRDEVEWCENAGPELFPLTREDAVMPLPEPPNGLVEP